MSEKTELVKILCRQVLLNKYIKFNDLEQMFANCIKDFKIKADFKEIINEVRYRLENVGLNAKKITLGKEDYITVTIPFDSKYIKRNRLDEVGLSLLALVINYIDSQDGKIPQPDLEKAFKKYIVRLKSFISASYLELIELEGEVEKYYIVTPLGLAIILDAKENLSQIVKNPTGP